MLNILLSVFVSAVAQSSQPSTERQSSIPHILEAAFKQRTSFETAYFRVRREDERPSLGHVPQVHNHEYQWGGGNLHFTDNGNDEGIRLIDPRTGAAMFGVANACLPANYLLDSREGTLFVQQGSDAYGGIQKPDIWKTYVDIRTAGLRMMEVQVRGPMELLQMLRDDADKRFSEKIIEADLVRISCVGAKHKDGAFFEFEWDIDPKKGPAITGTREWFTDAKGKRSVAGECHIDLMQIDGRWWPSRVEYTNPNSPDRSTIEFQKVEFDRPTHPKKIDLEALGIPIGAPIRDPKSGEQRYAGNGKLMSEDEWKRVEGQYDSTPLRAWRAQLKAMGNGYVPAWWDLPVDKFGLEGVAERPDLWEAYVRRWMRRRIANYRWEVVEPLTEGQKNAAFGVLADCRKKAVVVSARLDSEKKAIDSEIIALEKKSAASKTTARSDEVVPAAGKAALTNTDAADQKSHVAALRSKLDELSKSKEISTLFSELKSRLDGLLTEPQRSSGGGRLKLVAPPSSDQPRNSFAPGK